MVRILAATDRYREEMPSDRIGNGRRIRGLVLLLGYSGMRIGDAARTNSKEIAYASICRKRGSRSTQSFPNLFSPRSTRHHESQTRFVLERQRKTRSIVRSWQTRLRNLFKLANIPDSHAHRFRDTSAVELLLSGVPIERVSIVLGHQGVRIADAPWVRSRQEQLEADLTRA